MTKWVKAHNRILRTVWKVQKIRQQDMMISSSVISQYCYIAQPSVRCVANHMESVLVKEHEDFTLCSGLRNTKSHILLSLT